MENLITIFGWNLVAVIVLMTCGWLISLIYKNVSIVDSLWGLGFVLIAWLTFGQAEGFTGRKILIVLLTTVHQLSGVESAIRKIPDQIKHSPK